MPRIGAGTPGFQWYTAEHLIRKCLVGKGIDTYVYLYRIFVLAFLSSTERDITLRDQNLTNHHLTQPLPQNYIQLQRKER